MFDSLTQSRTATDPATATGLAAAASAIARLDEALAGHAFLYRARLEAVRRQAAVDGRLIDPWQLAAVREGLRLGAVVMFGLSDALGGTYGIAVSMLMAITTVLAALVAMHWGYNLSLVLAVNGILLLVDLIFVAAGMAPWRKSLFSTMHLNANLPAAYFGVPAAHVVEVGLDVEI